MPTAFSALEENMLMARPNAGKDSSNMVVVAAYKKAMNPEKLKR